MNKHLKYFFYLTLVFFSLIIKGQKQGNIWYFSNQAGLNFNTTNPSALTNGQTDFVLPIGWAEGSSVISDSSGSLLFYSNGVKIWNRNHVVMPNGTGLSGHRSSTQSCVIVPRPGSQRFFYVFTTDAQENSYANGLRYSVVDMCLDNGFGDVVPGMKNIPMVSTTSEKLICVPHTNNIDYWIVTHKFQTDAFYACLLTNTGITTTVISNTGTADLIGVGQMVASPNGLKIAYAMPVYTLSAGALLFDFNPSTGVVSNEQVLEYGGRIYGVSFSPNSTKVYFSTIGWGSLFQFDLSAGSLGAIISSKNYILTNGPDSWRQHQLGPDGKIYLSRSGKSYISRITNPNSLCPSCNYVDSAIYLAGKFASFGLPNFVTGYNYKNKVVLSLTVTPSTQTICPGSTATLTASGATSYTWNTLQNTAVITPTVLSATVFSVNGNGGDVCPASATVNVGSIIGVNGATVVCPGKTTTLTSYGASTYSWSTGVTSPSVVISPTTTTVYTVTGMSAPNCTDQKTITVLVNLIPTLSIVGNNTVCLGSVATQTAYGAISYSLNNTLSPVAGSIISVFPFVNSTFTVYGTGANTCVNQQTFAVNVLPLPVLQTSGSSTICAGAPLNLVVSGVNTYTWYSATPAPLTSPQAGIAIYTLSGTGAFGCVKSQTVAIMVNQTPSITINGNNMLCQGATATLNAIGGSSTYTWNTGSTNSTLLVSPAVSSTYIVSGTSAFGCTNTAVTIITVNPLPVISVTGNNTVCAGSSVLLSVSGANSYIWSNTVNTSTVNLSPQTNSTYTVTGTDINGCANQQTVGIFVFPIPNLVIAGTTTGCVGPGVTLQASGANTYSWTTGVMGSVLNISSPGNFTCNVVGTSSMGCVNTQSLTLSVFPMPTLSIISSVAGNVTFCQGAVVSFSANGASSYTWSNGLTNNVLTLAPPAGINIYTVTGSDLNGCIASGTVAVSVAKCLGMEQIKENNDVKVFPNPSNGQLKIETIAPLHIFLYNDLGALVFEKNLRAGFNEIDLNNLSNGIYLLRYTSDKKYIALKLVKSDQ